MDTCKSQLLYEIQGPWYFNSDVTAILDEICFEQLSSNRVALSGVKSGPPPPTTKVGITARGGFQAEMHWFLVELDIEAKARMREDQIRGALGDTSKFSVLSFSLNGSAAEDPTDQNAATVDFRIFAQAMDIAVLMPDKFLRPMMDLIMCAYPWRDFSSWFDKGYQSLFMNVTLLPQSNIKNIVHTHNNITLNIPPPKITKTWTDSSSKDFGETVRGPLGWLIHARSGDKGSNANFGFWVWPQDECEWMRTL